MNGKTKNAIAFCVCAITAVASIVAALGSMGDSFDDWISSATDDELEAAYEERRQQWLKNGQNGTGIKTPEMMKIDSEMSRRSAIKWQNDPKRSRDKNYRWTDANRWEKD